MANFTIEMYRPLVVASSVDYEKSKFKEYLKVNPGQYIVLFLYQTDSIQLCINNYCRVDVQYVLNFD